MAQHETFHRKNRLLAIYAIAFEVFLYLAILFIPVFSFNSGIYVKFPLEAFTLDWYADLMGSPVWLNRSHDAMIVLDAD